MCRERRVRVNFPSRENVTASILSRNGSSNPGGSASLEGPMMPPPHVLYRGSSAFSRRRTLRPATAAA